MIERPNPSPREAVLVLELARSLRRSFEGIRIMARRLNIETFRVPNEKGGPSMIAVTPDDARKIIAEIPKPVKLIKPEELLGGE